MMQDQVLRAIEKAAKKNIRKLDLSDTGLTELPPEIGQLKYLHSLYLSSNRLTTLSPAIGQLKNLQILNLRGNQLRGLPPEIGQLKYLHTLDLSSNPLTKLLPEIGQLKNLQILDLNSNRFSVFPPEIGQLNNLHSLYLSSNQLTILPPEIGWLEKLQGLSLSSNRLRGFPPEIGQLENLRGLNLRANQLRSFPPEIEQLTNLHSLYLSSNPLLKTLPPEIRRYCDDPLQAAIEFPRYYRQIFEQKIDHLYEAKLLIIGEGGAGKTSLAKKIENETYQLADSEKSTEGIDIIHWKFPFKNNQEFTVNIWDFGGQEIYHATHQFFLTKRSLYILVADSRKEDTDFFYWLNVVNLLSRGSPILIIKNEKQDRQREINERQLRSEFLNLEKVLATNLANNRGLSAIKQAIKHFISSLPHVGTELPKTWVKVRKALEDNPRNHITLEEYLTLCQNNGFTRFEDKLQLSGYLHDLGVFLHFQEDDLLRKTVILKPTWGTDAVYKVLDNKRLINNLGKFNRDDLAAIWHEEQYATMRPELLRLMMNFKLCYEIPSSPNTYIAPQLLSINQPEYVWDKTDNLLLRSTYDFMPKGILTRFIVEMHCWIEKETQVWKDGVVLNKDDSRAEVIELYHRKEIQIRVCGDRKRDLLTTIRHELDKIHNSYESLKYKTMVPCNCSICKGNQKPHFYPLERLYQFQKDKQETIQCQISYEMIEVQALVDDVDQGPPLEQQDIEDSSQFSSSQTTPDSKYQINAHSVQIVETTAGGDAVINKYASNHEVKKAINNLLKFLNYLERTYPEANPDKADDIINTEITKIQNNKPQLWKGFRQQLRSLPKDLRNPERLKQAGKSTLMQVTTDLTDNIFLNAMVAFLDGLSGDV